MNEQGSIEVNDLNDKERITQDFTSNRPLQESRTNFNLNNRPSEFQESLDAQSNLKNRISAIKSNYDPDLESIDEVEAQTAENMIPEKRRILIFSMFLLSNIFLNYDTGAIPASLLEIIKEINFDYKEQALLASLSYLGISFFSIFVDFTFKLVSPGKMISFSLCLNSLFCFLFSSSIDKTLIFISRFFMGATSAFSVVYTPVWVNNFSPPDRSSTWLGIAQSCSVTGVVLGYIVAGLIINFFKGIVTWRLALQIQAIFELVFCIYFFLEKNKYIDINDKDAMQKNDTLKNKNVVEDKDKINLSINKDRDKDKDKDNYNSSENNEKYISSENSKGIESYNDTDGKFTKYLYQIKAVLTNKVFIFITLGLCGIFFIVAGIQFWISAYLVRILEMDQLDVVISFSIVSVSAPIGGVLVGGMTADKYGGYKGKNSIKAIKICLLFGLVPCFVSFLLSSIFSPVYFIIILWFFLFFGASIIPVATGVMVSSVRKKYQSISSSIGQFIFNIFGYFLSPILTGIIMDIFTVKKRGFIWGMRVLFFWAFVAEMFVYFSYRNDIKKYDLKDNKELIQKEEMENQLGEMVNSEIRKKMKK